MKAKVVGVIVFVGFIACLVWASTAPHYKPSAAEECLVHIKGRILMSLALYAEQHDGHLPKTLDALVKEGFWIQRTLNALLVTHLRRYDDMNICRCCPSKTVIILV